MAATVTGTGRAAIVPRVSGSGALRSFAPESDYIRQQGRGFDLGPRLIAGVEQARNIGVQRTQRNADAGASILRSWKA